jgi:acyl transferase domain-containing protein/acyl carrier protein
MSQLLDRIAALPADKRAALAEMLRPAPEPIAIVGIGCRFGGADSPAAFWDLLNSGRDVITEVPRDRWNIDAHYDPDPDAAGKVASRWGSFIDGADRFDAHFFGIGTHEAARMDPHQRLLLEVAWEALEHGGINPQRLARSATGVFLGAYHSDFSQLALSDADRIDLYSGTGTANNVLAGRLSYFLDLRGPSLVVDTACSSGLVAVHLACQSLRNRECDMALAGGVTVLLTPLSLVMASRMGLVARDGRCKTFDARADGIVMGDGCGVVVLKRLSVAVAEGDHVLAVIRGVAVNQDGRTNGLTAPNVLSQQTLLRNALRDGGVEPDSVTCIEAHGTGTSLGDPIEIEALTHVVGQPRSDGSRCAIGSVKTNIGHVGAAAGLAGLIKMVLCLQHRRLVPHLNFTQLNPNITLDGTPFYIPQTSEPWHAEGPRRAGVSAFGWSGTNAHAILEEAPAPVPVPETEARPRHLLFLSAMKASSLDALAARYEQHLQAQPSLAVEDVCHTAAIGRAHLPHRLAVEGGSLDQIRERLSRFRSGERTPGIQTGEAPQRRPQPVFLFTGQGSQYVGMGRSLYRTQPTFRRELDRCDEILTPWLGRSIVSVMHDDQDTMSIDDTAWTQPAIFALGWSLAALWRSWGVVPAAVMGHSVGELAAACVAGVFPLEDGLALVSARGRIVQALPLGGLMAAVFASEAQVAPVVARRAHALAIAALNGPEETVISGDPDAVHAAIDELTSAGLRTRRLTVSHAFHSPRMDPALDALEQAAASVRYSSPQIPFVSSVTGRLADEHELTTPAYWRRQLREPVRFADAIRVLHERGHRVFFEIGPRPTLSAMARRCLPDDTGLWLSSLDKDKDDWEQMLNSLGAWYAHGGDVNVQAFDADYRPRRVQLPTYPFQRDRYPLPVIAPSQVEQGAAERTAANGHPLLGARLRSPLLQDAVYECRLGMRHLSYLGDHRVYGSPLLPMTGYVEMVLAAAADALGPEVDTLTDLILEAPMIFGEDEERIAQVLIRTDDAAHLSFQVFSRTVDGDGTWTRHLAGGIERATDTARASIDIERLKADCTSLVPRDAFYQWLDAQGLHYGPGFRGLLEIRRGDGQALGQVRLPDILAGEAGRYRAHPALLDACDQIFAAALAEAEALAPDSDIYLPLGVERIRIIRPLPANVWSHCRVQTPHIDHGAETLTADIQIADEHGGLVAEVHGLLLKRAPRGALAGAMRHAPNGWFHHLQWQTAPSVHASAPRPSAWILVADTGGSAARLAGRLAADGQTVVTVTLASSFEQHDTQTFSLRAAAAEDHRRFWQVMRDTYGDRIAGVVHMASLDLGAAAGDTATWLEDQERGCASALHLLQALVADGHREAPTVWLVTRGAQAVDAARRNAGAMQASLWGLGRTVALEYPALRCTLIDLDPLADDDERLHAEIGGTGAEPQIAFRDGKRFVARIAARGPLPPSQTDSAPARVRPDRTYLITGGLSGIGLRTARWLVDQGARHLVLVSRRDVSDAANREIHAMEQAGAHVLAARADISHVSEVARVLDDTRRTMPPLAGIVHSAGVIDDATLPQQHWDRFARVMAPKIGGALHLHTLTRDLPLDFFVLFSSIAGCFGSPGQANYAAANACLDALAHQRHALGLPALSVNWGAWSETGMAARLGDADRRRLADRGLSQMLPDQALQALGEALGTSAAQLLIVPIDWSMFLSQFTADTVPPIFSQMVKRQPARSQTVEWAERIAAAAPAQRQDLLRGLVAAEAIKALGLDPAQPLDPQRSLYDIGLNSLIALDLSRAIAGRIGRTLPATMLFNYSTVEAIGRYLSDDVFSNTPAQAAPAHPSGATAHGVLQQIEDLSDEEVDRLLASKARR